MKKTQTTTLKKKKVQTLSKEQFEQLSHEALRSVSGGLGASQGPLMYATKSGLK